MEEVVKKLTAKVKSFWKENETLRAKNKPSGEDTAPN